MKREKTITQRVSDFESRFSPEPNTGCWFWTASQYTNGYGWFNLGRGRTKLAHRASWILNRGEIPRGQWVLHKCDQRSCVNPSHLFLGCAIDNTRDMLQKGRHRTGDRTGEKNGRAKLSESDVRWILASGASSSDLGRKFNVSKSTVAMIKAGINWRHISVSVE